MLLIGESGSTKTHWKIVDKKKVDNFHTEGINPFFVRVEQIKNTLINSIFFQQKKNISNIHFYGAGLGSEEQKKMMKEIFSTLFENAKDINVSDDLLAAARALFYNKKGIACILGTGSNSGFYNGNNIAQKIPALGYIIGDEGSGAHIGKTFLNAFFKGDFSEKTQKKLIQLLDVNRQDVLNNIYKKPLANRYLASYAKRIFPFLDEPEIATLVKKCLHEFVQKNILKYPDYKTQKIGFVGSVAFYFHEILEEVLMEYNIKNIKIILHPIESLEYFHSQFPTHK